MRQTTPARVKDIECGEVLDCDSMQKFWMEWSDRYMCHGDLLQFLE